MHAYGISEPESWISCRPKDYRISDWVLAFPLGKNPENPEWMFVDYVVRVPQSDKKAYDRENPCQAVQVWKRKSYAVPPFNERSKKFRKAFEKAISNFGLSQVRKMKSCKPPKGLIDLIYEHF